MSSQTSPDRSLEILFQDDHLVAINKPAGLLVHRTEIARSVKRFAMQELRNQVGMHVYPVHRLDRPTSGVLLFAKSPAIATALNEQFASRTVEKTYLAIVRGWVPENGTIDRPLRENTARVGDPTKTRDADPLPAETRFSRIGKAEVNVPISRHATSRFSLVLTYPVSGRQHQIRRHLRAIGYPIIGDTRHGDRLYNRYVESTLNCSQMLLAAVSTRFRHPVSDEMVVIQARIDRPFAEMISWLGLTENVPPGWMPVINS